MAAKVKRTVLVDVEGIVKGKNDAFVLAVARQGAGRAQALVTVDTGALKQSINAKALMKGLAMYGTNKEYGPYIEFGTRHQSAQPYLRPSADWLKTNGSKLYARLLKGALKRG